MCRAFNDAGVIAIAALISPFRDDREAARLHIGVERFLEVYVATELAVCEQRDPKGLYQRALAGEIPDFTGISSPYEPPTHPDLVVGTGAQSLDACVRSVLELLDAHTSSA
jgi:adenylylsulfate kinase